MINNNINHDHSGEFRCCDLGLAAFLSFKGNKLLGVERDPTSHSGFVRGLFVFSNAEGNCNIEEQNYNSMDGVRSVDAKFYFEEIKNIKNILYYNLEKFKKPDNIPNK